MCSVLCLYVNRILDLEALVTTNAQTIILGIDPKMWTVHSQISF